MLQHFKKVLFPVYLVVITVNGVLKSANKLLAIATNELQSATNLLHDVMFKK